jgi:hypothetical protein
MLKEIQINIQENNWTADCHPRIDNHLQTTRIEIDWGDKAVVITQPIDNIAPPSKN